LILKIIAWVLEVITEKAMHLVHTKFKRNKFDKLTKIQYCWKF